MAHRSVVGPRTRSAMNIGSALQESMSSRAFRRLQDSVRWVLAALEAMIFAPWAPHPRHPGRPRLQRLAYDEPVAVGTLPKYRETPTAKPKTVRFETPPSASVEQSSTRQRQEADPPEEPSGPAKSSSSDERSTDGHARATRTKTGTIFVSRGRKRTANKNVKDHLK